MTKLLDANLILRYLLNDDPKKASAVEKLLKSSKEPLVLSDVTVAEIIWVLTSFYQFQKEEVVDKIEALLVLNIIDANHRLLGTALSLYRLHNLAYVDAYLAAYAQKKKLDGIYSYDRDFDRIKEIRRYEP